MSIVPWTIEDEFKLQALTARKQEIFAQHMPPLVALVSAHLAGGDGAAAIAQAMARRAYVFREALRPFDSGVRAA